jgi:hypothetical protein
MENFFMLMAIPNLLGKAQETSQKIGYANICCLGIGTLFLSKVNLKAGIIGFVVSECLYRIGSSYLSQKQIAFQQKMFWDQISNERNPAIVTHTLCKIIHRPLEDMVEKIRSLKGQGQLREASDESNWRAYRQILGASADSSEALLNSAQRLTDQWNFLKNSNHSTDEMERFNENKKNYQKHVESADNAAIALRWRQLVHHDQDQTSQARAYILDHLGNGRAFSDPRNGFSLTSVSITSDQVVQAQKDLFELAMRIYRKEESALREKAVIEGNYNTFILSYGETSSEF